MSLSQPIFQFNSQIWGSFELDAEIKTQWKMYHPDLDDSSLHDQKRASITWSMIRRLNQVIPLGCFDVNDAINIHSSFTNGCQGNACPKATSLLNINFPSYLKYETTLEQAYCREAIPHIMHNSERKDSTSDHIGWCGPRTQPSLPEDQHPYQMVQRETTGGWVCHIWFRACCGLNSNWVYYGAEIYSYIRSPYWHF